jgi:hypothetical protein
MNLDRCLVSIIQFSLVSVLTKDCLNPPLV